MQRRNARRIDSLVVGIQTPWPPLAKRGLRFLILDAHERIGDSWRKRWDSLRLFTPARYDGLDGMPFPAPSNSFPTKDEMGDYLEAYIARFKLPVRSGLKVDRLFRRNGCYVVAAGDIEMQANQVVVAMTNYQQRRFPAYARELRDDIVQIHSSDYRNPGALRPGGVLIVGAGNSGSEIAMELVRSHPTWMSGRDTGHVPFRISGFWGRNLLVHVKNVIWCTGYHANFSWIDLPVLDNDGEPIHQGGVIDDEPGLYFVGLHFLYAMSSTMIHGVGRDAARIVRIIAERAGRAATERRRVA